MLRSMMYVAISDVSANFRAPYGVCGPAERVQRRVDVEVERLVGRDAPTVGGTVKDVLQLAVHSTQR